MVRVAAVQWVRQPLDSLRGLEAAVEAPVAEAARLGAALVAFPAGVDEVLCEVLGCAAGHADARAAGEHLSSRLAKAYGVTLAMGPAWVAVPGGRERRACLFGPDGRLLGCQAQTHCGTDGPDVGLVVGSGLAPIATPAGLVGLLCGADVEYPEAGRILCLQGAAILVHQAALPCWSEPLALSRLWREVQANQVFGIEAYCVGAGWRGRSAIHAPLEMTPGGCGWLAQAPDDAAPAVVVADLDLGRLHKVVEGYPIHALRNEHQYRRYFPSIYASMGLGAQTLCSDDLGRRPGDRMSPRREEAAEAATTRTIYDVGAVREPPNVVAYCDDAGAVREPPLQGYRTPAYEPVLAGALWPVMRVRSRGSLVRVALEGLSFQPAANLPPDRPRIGVVQFDINLTFSAAAYARHAYTMVRQAVEGGASLVVFPEYATLPLLGLLPGARKLAAMLEGGSDQGEAGHAESGGGDAYATMALAFRLAAPAARRVYWATFSTLAARFHVTIVAGSAVELGHDGRLYNVGYLFGPDGGLLARQVKTHLVPSEVAMGYGVGDEILVTETRAGRLAFPICMDHTYFETARIAALQGADLLIDPSANNEYYNPYAQARGVWNRVQEVHTYGVLCSGVGRVAGSAFQGKSGVYAPLGMTPGGDGIVAQARTCDGEEVVFADLDYAALRDDQRRQPLTLNRELYQRYLPAAYGN